MLPELLEQISKDQPIAMVSANGAYDTKACHEAIAARNACAVIPARRNAKVWPENTPPVDLRNKAVYRRTNPKTGRCYIGRCNSEGFLLDASAIMTGPWARDTNM